MALHAVGDGQVLMRIRIRPLTAADVQPCGRIIYQAFKSIADLHNFPPDFPSLEAAVGVAGLLVAHPSIFAVGAEVKGRLIGSNFLDERGAVRAVGPITVDPESQERGIGRRLMRAVLERAEGSVSVRLVQDAFNTLSMPLYASLGFEVKEPLALMQGTPKSRPPSGVDVRPLKAEDLEECGALCRKVHGFDRINELRDAIGFLQPIVAVRAGRITAYATSLTLWGRAHGVADSEEDLEALILGAPGDAQRPVSFLLPTRRAGLFRWCLDQGLRMVKPMTLMAMGTYPEPRGCFFPSVSY